MITQACDIVHLTCFNDICGGVFHFMWYATFRPSSYVFYLQFQLRALRYLLRELTACPALSPLHLQLFSLRFQLFSLRLQLSPLPYVSCDTTSTSTATARVAKTRAKRTLTLSLNCNSVWRNTTSSIQVGLRD